MGTRKDQTFRLRIDGDNIHGSLQGQPVLFDLVVTLDRRAVLAEGVHVCDGEGAELECRIDRLDASTGQVRGWVMVPRLEPGVDVELQLVPGVGGRQLSPRDLARSAKSTAWREVDSCVSSPNEARPESSSKPPAPLTIGPERSMRWAIRSSSCHLTLSGPTSLDPRPTGPTHAHSSPTEYCVW